MFVDTMKRPRYFALVGTLLLLGACTDRDIVRVIEPPDTNSNGPLSPNVFERAISEPIALAAFMAGTGNGREPGTVYVAFAAGELPNARTARLSNHTTGEIGTVAFAVNNGALDPVAVQASIGDTLELFVVNLDGSRVSMRAAVPSRRPPRVIRTDPPKGRTDIGLSSKVRVVFSEPIDPASVTTASIRLLAGTQVVAGTIVTESSALAAEFLPGVPLAAATAYTLIISRAVRDLEGDALQRADTVQFSTATGNGRVRATTVTTGVDPDPDGYTVQVVGSSSVSISGNGSATTAPLNAGNYTVALKGVAANCAVAGGGTRQVTIAADATISIDFEIECTPATLLAFVRDSQIYLVKSNGSGLVQLTHSPTGVSNEEPAWSPDGSRIAFVRRERDSTNIYLMNADGSNVVRRTNQGALNISPSWSPDGRRIAFSSLRDGQVGLYVMAVDGDWANPSHVGHPQGVNLDPAWSPDGNTILFVSDWRAFDFLYDIYAMNDDGSQIRSFVEGPFFFPTTYYFQPSWSPDGQKIALVVCAYAFDNCYPDSSLMLVDPSGAGRTFLTTAGGFAKPSWSPDSRTLAFTAAACSACPASIRYVRIDGSYEDVIVANGYSPSWRR